ncbi:MAG: GtrA family protein [Sulfurospirillaceae bacterium]|nr:GtrA family protein [Sulfurospirillaceae bacterium]
MKIVKFFTTSLLATGVDFCLYTILLLFATPVISHFISATCGMIVNFILQKKFVFTLNRALKVSFILSLCFSVGGIFLGAGIIYGLTQWSFFLTYPLIAKIVAIGVVFFYNYQTKKIAFGDR